jgi:hypothetical protein
MAHQEEEHLAALERASPAGTCPFGKTHVARSRMPGPGGGPACARRRGEPRCPRPGSALPGRAGGWAAAGGSSLMPILVAPSGARSRVPVKPRSMSQPDRHTRPPPRALVRWLTPAVGSRASSTSSWARSRSTDTEPRGSRAWARDSAVSRRPGHPAGSTLHRPAWPPPPVELPRRRGIPSGRVPRLSAPVVQTGAGLSRVLRCRRPLPP